MTVKKFATEFLFTYVDVIIRDMRNTQLFAGDVWKLLYEGGERGVFKRNIHHMGPEVCDGVPTLVIFVD